MNDEQRRRHERSVRVRNYCEQLTEPFAPDSRGGRALASLKGNIQQCEELDALQSTHKQEAQQGTSRRKELRESLRAQLSAIGATARVIGKENPAVRGRFRLADSRGNDQALLSSARSFLAEATPLKSLFLEYDMPADFLQTLSATINDFEQAVNQQDTGAGGRVQSRASIDDLQTRSANDIETLNTVIRNKYRNDLARLAAWESASRLERAPKSASKNAGSQGNEPAPGT